MTKQFLLDVQNRFGFKLGYDWIFSSVQYDDEGEYCLEFRDVYGKTLLVVELNGDIKMSSKSNQAVELYREITRITYQLKGEKKYA